jgi:hypothetical protein
MPRNSKVIQTSVIVGVLLLAYTSRAAAQSAAPVEYRVLFEQTEFYRGGRAVADEGATPRHFEVSVDRWLDPEDVRALVCTLAAEKVDPEETKGTVGFSFHHRLEDVGVLVRAGEGGEQDYPILLERRIGGYSWSETYADEKGGGTIELRKDGAGKPLESRLVLVFDHRGCGPKEPAVEIIHAGDALQRPVPVPTGAGTESWIATGATARFRLHFGRRGGVQRVELLEVVANSPVSSRVEGPDLEKELEAASMAVLRVWPTLRFEPFQLDVVVEFGVDDALSADRMLYRLEYGTEGPDPTTMHPRRVVIRQAPETAAEWSGSLSLPPALDIFRGLPTEFRARFLTKWRRGYLVGVRTVDVDVRTPHDPLPSVPDLASDIELWAWTTVSEWRNPEWESLDPFELEVEFDFQTDSTLAPNEVVQLVEYLPVSAGSEEMYPARIVIRASPVDTGQWRERIERYREHEEWLRLRKGEPGPGPPG